MNKTLKMIRSVLTPISKAMAIVFTLTYGVLTVGTAIAYDNVSVVNDHFGNKPNTVYIDNGEETESSNFYQSEYESVNEVRGSGINYTTTTMEEGAVLLKNDNSALPLKSTDKVSFFSVSSAKPVISGYRESGKNQDVVSFKDAFKDAGIEVNEGLFDWYAASSYGRQSLFGNAGFGNAYNINEAPWSELPASKTASGYKTAVFVISRIGGEASDVQLRDLGENRYNTHAQFDGKKGNYLVLSENEENVLQNLKEEKAKGTFDKIIAIMNTTNQVACDFEDKYDVDALLYSGSIGTAGTRGIANIFKGTVSPSGKLSDTFWKNHYLNPVHANWGANSFNGSGEPHYNSAAVVYQEGIYSGYRYTETRYFDKVAGADKVGDYVYQDVVAYPFGYGLSYSAVSYSGMNMEYNAETDAYDVTVKVHNGNYETKDSVQLFLQKPYTEYDKQKGIEKAAVELVDFAKTEKMQANGETTVTLSVPRRELASYDSYGEKTYILENGTYYLAIGKDAHDAANNILAANGKTGMIDRKGNSVSGDSDLVKKIEINDSTLYKAYSTSAHTAAEITNQFDDVDLKLYKNSGDNKDRLTYFTRQDWAGTVKFGFNADGTQISGSWFSVSVNADMQADMTQTAQGVEGDLPTMGSTATAWQLIDLLQDEEGNPIPYDDPKWDELLDQLTYAEMAEFLSDAYGFTKEIQSITKPYTTDQDSDLGVINSYAYGSNGLANKLADPDKSKSPAAYLDSGIIAATRNSELLHEYGLQWGEDCLWSGYSGLYGTGANIHRSPYNGRTYGYYSEDPVLMGKCVAQINIGMEEKGAFMLLKHCMLNEQEAGRIGVCTWANEQTIREVYLKPFQIAIEAGGVQGVMTSLNRLGTISAPHHTFLNNVLRKEFGMTGYCVTDSLMDHMNLPSMLLAGNDLPLGQTSILKNQESKYNTREYANVVWAMRDATHNILYSVVHSNAMNGMGSNTRIITFQPEWQYYLEKINPIALVMIIVSVSFYGLMEIWSYFGNDEKKKLSDTEKA